ncbi:MAG: hypothetical protein HC945_00445 [Nitrosarchaeum sp.]|nr:hypothetical protein [Nitrosarchaeum sp.]
MEEPDNYLKFADGSGVYRYKLDFDERLELSVVDGRLPRLEGRSLEMLGASFLVVEAEKVGADHLRLKLMGGLLAETLREGEVKVFVLEGKEYEVSAQLISEDEEVLLVVNGEQVTVEEGETAVLEDGLRLGVLDVLVNDREGLAEVVLGGKEYVLEDVNVTETSVENQLEVDGSTVYGSDVQITGSDAVTLETIEITWTARDDFFVAPDSRLSPLLEEDALFPGSWDFHFAGFRTKDSKTEVYLEASGDDVFVLSFVPRSGREYEVPLFFDDAGAFTRLGDEDEALVMDEGTAIRPDDLFVVTSDGSLGRWSSEGYTRVLVYEELNEDEDYLVFSDLATGDAIHATFSSNATSLTADGFDYDVLINDTEDPESVIWVDLDNDGSIASGRPVIVLENGATLDVSGFTRLYYTTKELEEGVALSTWQAYGTTESVDSFEIVVESTSDGIDVSGIRRCIGANYEQILAANVAYYRP